MSKLQMKSASLTRQNILRLGELFPGCVVEVKDDKGVICRAVDFERLRQELGDSLVEGERERYHLDWPGKRESLVLANAPVTKTLRPLRDESVDFDTTKNLFLEGDNLDALKLIQENYLGKVKMIYIDPPYNTGKDFIYEDDFSEDANSYLLRSNQKDENKNRLVENKEANGRFHSDWLSMMNSRLRLSQSLLRPDGVIFISISDQEMHGLKFMCDEIFGAQNHMGTIMWNSTKSVTGTALVSVAHTYNLIYARDKNYFIDNREHFRLPEDGSGFSNPDNDPRGPWKADPFQVGGWRPNQQYTIVNPKTGKEYRPNPGSSWKNDYDKFQKLIRDNRIIFGTSGEAGPQRKRFLSDAKNRGKVAKTWWDDVGTTTNGTMHLKNLFDQIAIFPNPKPVDLIERFIQLGDHTGEGIILDFFGGSGTTAEAVIKTNAEGSNRKFIIVQIDEEIPEGNEAEKTGFKTIAEIGRERIRRAGKKIMEGDCHLNWNRDVGFRLLKIDTSNMKDVFYRPDEFAQQTLDGMVDNVKADRSGEDLLFQVLVDWGVDLSLPIARETLSSNTVFVVGEDVAAPDLIACFDANIGEDLMKLLAKRHPLRVVFRDTGFATDSVKINAQQIFKQFSSTTEFKTV